MVVVICGGILFSAGEKAFILILHSFNSIPHLPVTVGWRLAARKDAGGGDLVCSRREDCALAGSLACLQRHVAASGHAIPVELKRQATGSGGAVIRCSILVDYVLRGGVAVVLMFALLSYILLLIGCLHLFVSILRTATTHTWTTHSAYTLPVATTCTLHAFAFDCTHLGPIPATPATLYLHTCTMHSILPVLPFYCCIWITFPIHFPLLLPPPHTHHLPFPIHLPFHYHYLQ